MIVCSTHSCMHEAFFQLFTECLHCTSPCAGHSSILLSPSTVLFHLVLKFQKPRVSLPYSSLPTSSSLSNLPPEYLLYSFPFCLTLLFCFDLPYFPSNKINHPIKDVLIQVSDGNIWQNLYPDETTRPLQEIYIDSLTCSLWKEPANNL